MGVMNSFAGNGRRPVLLEFRSSTTYIVASISTAIFTDIFLYAVIVPVFPFSLVSRVGIKEEKVQYWLSVLLAMFDVGLIVGAPVCGILADRVGFRKGPLLLGLLLELGSTLLLCLAKNLPLLAVGRVLQGVSASMTWVVGASLIVDTAKKQDVAKALGYVGTAVSLGSLVGPLLGGVVYQGAGYYAVFGICFGALGLDILLRLTLIEKKTAAIWLDESSDTIGDSTEKTSGKLAATNAATTDEHSSEGVTEPSPSEKPNTLPILKLLTSRHMLVTLWANLAQAIIMCGLDTTLTLFLNRTFGWNSRAAGLMSLAILIPTLFGPVCGYFVDKYGSRWLCAFGLTFMVTPFVLLRLVDHDSIRQKVLLGALLALIGLGVAMTSTGLMTQVSKVCDAEVKKNPKLFGQNGAYAQSYALLEMSWASGGLIGAFWSGGVYGTADWGTMGWSFALLCGVTAIPVLLFIDGWIGKLWKKTS